LLKKHKCRYNLILVENKLLDILPQKASKYGAIKYLSHKWHINEKDVLVAGDSGNDYEMLRGFKNAVVVANHQEELKGKTNLYYSDKPCAGAILDGINKFNFMEDI
jgi:sucrose-phosphate synthase